MRTNFEASMTVLLVADGWWLTTDCQRIDV